VASDNFQAGVLAGEALKKTRAAGARIAALTYPPNKACRDRIAGFQQAIAGDARFEIVAEQALESGTAEAAHPILKDIIQRLPELTAVFAINDPSAFGALTALEQAGKLKEVVVLAVDGNARALEEIQGGRMLGTSAQFPEEIGREAAKALYLHLERQPVPKEIKIPVEFIDASNVAHFQKQPGRS
jgi:ribose transport system substrate-binding protein